jgi:hypothetical protein
MVSRNIFLMQKLQVTKLQRRRDPSCNTGEISKNLYEDKKIDGKKLSKGRKQQAPLWGLLLLRKATPRRMNRKEN